MRHLFAVLLILLLAVAPSCNYLRNKGIFSKKARTLAAYRAQQDSIRVIDSLRKVHEHLLALENAKLDSIRLNEEERLAREKESKYNIIVGSFITPEFAVSFADEFRQQGYDTKIVKLEGTDFELVSAETHNNLREAVSRLQRFQDTVAFDAWLYIRN